MQVKKAVLTLKNVTLHSRDIKKLQANISNLFRDQDIVHNHQANGRVIYRYPLIQFKLIDKTPTIVALTDKAIEIFTRIFLSLDKIEISGKTIAITEKDITMETMDIGYQDEMISYEFISPWLGLNQAKYEKYIRSGHWEERKKLLNTCLTGNLLSLLKGLEIWLSEAERIQVDLDLREKPVHLKGNPLLGFTGTFQTNIKLSDYLGLGKSVSRGFGTIKKII
ncbi:MAG: CRISPR-associated endonuclease Cas6 [Spirochaetota bacterium]|nr:CRISPR-associated endonuclease Cas6 [Spirochaetota bacterium]